MALTPRKDEVAAIAEILEDPEWASGEAMAKAVLKQAWELFQLRTTYAYGWRDKGGGETYCWGPFLSESQVQKFGEKIGLTRGEHGAFMLSSPGALLERLEKGDSGNIITCTTCHHPIGAHEHPKLYGRCAVKECTCQTATKH
jgi:hypothetical protein